jgi:hypothetical protein
MDISEDLKSQVQNLPDHTRSVLKRMARLGFAAKGTVYLVLGWMTFQAALGLSSANIEVEDALLEISRQPFGKPMLAAVVFGLLGYVAWRFAQAILDTEDKGDGFKGIVRRTAYVVNGIAYSALTLAALQFLVGPPVKDGDTPRDLITQFLYYPAGRYLVGLAGLVVMAVGLIHFFRAYKAGFHKDLDTGKANRRVVRWSNRFGRFGSIARGVIYGLAGLLIIQAAVYQNPYRAGGPGEALRTLATSSYGHFFLAGVAGGLVAYGIFSLLAAVYNRIQIP